jgi:SAM-dependent methyltransferase
LIPDFLHRRGGKLSYAEWAHVIGIFQTLLYLNLKNKTGNRILDIGCGTGLGGIAAEPFISDGGNYTGIDIIKDDLDYCRKNFDQDNHTFIHMDVLNPAYTRDAGKSKQHWPVKDESFDMITAVSVWSHLNQEDAVFYMKEVARVMKKEGKAMITGFYMNDEYNKSIPYRSGSLGRYHLTRQDKWIFDKKAYNSENWYTTSWASYPEDVIGFTPGGLKFLLKESCLILEKYHSGNWKEIPGIFFQDILILRK